MAKFVNMRRWTGSRLDRELAFCCPDSPAEMEREWSVEVAAEAMRRAAIGNALAERAA